MTSLYFHGLANRAPYDKYDITVPSKYHNPKVNKHNVFYVSNDIYNLGKRKIKTALGNTVICYDVERSICDIIKNKKS